MSDEIFEGFVPPTKNYFPTNDRLVRLCYLMLSIVCHMATHFKQEVVTDRYFLLRKRGMA